MRTSRRAPGYVVLTFAPTRIRLLQIAPGLAESNPQRKLQPLPKVLGVSFDNGPCQTIHCIRRPASRRSRSIARSQSPDADRHQLGLSRAERATADQPDRGDPEGLSQLILRS